MSYNNVHYIYRSTDNNLILNDEKVPHTPVCVHTGSEKQQINDNNRFIDISHFALMKEIRKKTLFLCPLSSLSALNSAWSWMNDCLIVPLVLMEAGHMLNYCRFITRIKKYCCDKRVSILTEEPSSPQFNLQFCFGQRWICPFPAVKRRERGSVCWEMHQQILCLLAGG